MTRVSPNTNVTNVTDVTNENLIHINKFRFDPQRIGRNSFFWISQILKKTLSHAIQ
tara:strand:+ start:220 stop:387 length:168 start_codon:yes stop_codon:yes gene_type:complete